MDFELRVVKGRSLSQALKLADGVTTVGRQDECHVRIKSSQVSRKHCELFEKKGMLLVKDLGSANGTFVNGKKVSGQQVLEPGDELTIGGVKLRVARVGEEPPARGPAAGPKPRDTAVVDAVPVGVGEDEEFEIEFDEEAAIDAVIVEDDGFDIEVEDAPAPAPSPVRGATSASAPPASPPKKAAEPAQGPAPKPAREPQPPPVDAVVDGADEAIADFLLDIKLDDED